MMVEIHVEKSPLITFFSISNAGVSLEDIFEVLSAMVLHIFLHTAIYSEVKESLA